MKRALLALALLFLASSCAGKYVFDDPGDKEIKKERPLWWVLRHKQSGATELEYEDKWYEYEAEFDYITPGEDIQKNVIYGQCPIEKAEYKVTDKATQQVVRLEHITQLPCDQCHKR